MKLPLAPQRPRQECHAAVPLGLKCVKPLSVIVSVRPTFQLPTSPAPMSTPSSMSLSRDMPRHITMFPGGGSFALAKYPPSLPGEAPRLCRGIITREGT